MKLSIITPYYKCLNEIKKLIKILEPQLNNQVEWIIIDDGCDENELDNMKAKVIHLQQNSGGASIPRNKGLDIAQGEYITFIDADDLVSGNYIEKILEKTKEEWDYCFMSWSMDNSLCIIKDEPPSWNCCVWNCIYKRELIGEVRFREDLIKAEDYFFNKEVRKGKRANIIDCLYFYNTNNPNSLTKQNETYNSKYIR